MTTVAIIPARGGSKRLPGKNIKPLAGKPLIAWTIEAALQSHCFDHVVVSTENEDIAAVAQRYGATVPCLRPEELASDTAPTEPVIAHMVQVVEQLNDEVVDLVCLLQPTSPLRTDQDIIDSRALFQQKTAEAVVSVVESDAKPTLTNVLPEDLSLQHFISGIKRTQDSPVAYQLNGAIYWMKPHFSRDLLKIYQSERSFAYVMSKEHSVDIDTDFDFLWAEFLLSQK